MAIDEDDLAELDADIVTGDAEVQTGDGKRIKKRGVDELLKARSAAAVVAGGRRAARVSYIRIRDEGC
ncbi:MAG: hypothetical protein IT385_22395 [Deltaproteobacteria bacterium]|nr:hypothetical protein [Deltaproteobacteria bacterium]